MAGKDIDEDLQILDNKLGQLRLAYEQYFMGSRPREPVMLRQEVQKLVVLYSNQPITNTAARFKFNSLCARYQAFKRQWEDTLRKMELGTYARQRFRADLKQRQGEETGKRPSSRVTADRADSIFDAYVEARRGCGQEVKGLSPERFQQMVAKQERSLRERFGSDSQFRFRVVVEEGRAKLKASRGS